MLLKDSVDYTENPSTDRCNLGIKGSMVRVQVESIRDRESKSDDYRTLEEHEFRISKLDLSSLRVLNRRDCSKPTYSLGVAASMTERSSCSHYAEGDWQNSEGKDEFRVELRTSSLDGVLKAFRTLFDRAREEKVRKKPSRKKR